MRTASMVALVFGMVLVFTGCSSGEATAIDGSAAAVKEGLQTLNTSVNDSVTTLTSHMNLIQSDAQEIYAENAELQAELDILNEKVADLNALLAAVGNDIRTQHHEDPPPKKGTGPATIAKAPPLE